MISNQELQGELDKLDMRCRTLTTLLSRPSIRPYQERPQSNAYTSLSSPVSDVNLNPLTPISGLSLNATSLTSESPSEGHDDRLQRRREAIVQKTLKVLDDLALLIVQEHEVVAVLPHQDRACATSTVASRNYTCYVASDRSSSEASEGDQDSDDEALQRKSGNVNKSQNRSRLAGATLAVAVNPRKDKSPKVTHVTLISGDDQEDNDSTHQSSIFQFLLKNVTVSITEHIAKLEQLLKAARDPSPRNREANERQLAHYITFRCVPKMVRRFGASTPDKTYEILRSLSDTQILDAVGETSLKIPEDEVDIVRSLFTVNSGDPNLSWLQCEDLIYSKQTCCAFHRALVTFLSTTEDHVRELVQLRKSMICKETVEVQILRVKVQSVYKKMNGVLWMVYDSTVFQRHVQLLDRFLFVRAVVPSQQLFEDTNPIGLDFNDADDDSGPSDTDPSMIDEVAIEAPSQNSSTTLPPTGFYRPRFQNWLRILVSYQWALTSLTVDYLPHPHLRDFKFRMIQGPLPQAAESLEPWETVITNLVDSAISTGTEGRKLLPPGATAQEVLAILRPLLAEGKNQVLKFRGTYHAESTLATLHTLATITATGTAFDTCPDSTESAIDTGTLAALRESSHLIGVSKRCCPVCILILNSLSKLHPPLTTQPNLTEVFKISMNHRNIYPCAFPPGLPLKARQSVIFDLEILLLKALAKIILSERELAAARGRARDRENSDRRSGRKSPSGSSSGSADSAGKNSMPARRGQRLKKQARQAFGSSPEE